jgi:hypothetical protein
MYPYTVKSRNGILLSSKVFVEKKDVSAGMEFTAVE